MYEVRETERQTESKYIYIYIYIYIYAAVGFMLLWEMHDIDEKSKSNQRN